MTWAPREERPDAARAGEVAALAFASCLLIALATQYDFFCDDAFITLRYAQNLATHGSPIYNPPVYNPPTYDAAERVEGYTSFTWLVLAALGAKLPIALTTFVQALGALSSIGLLAASAALLRRLLGGQLAVRALTLLAVAATAPIAAWTMGGLETPLFAALTTWAFALALDLHGAPSPKRGVLLGAVLALATLTRPEGALVSAVVLLVLVVALIRSREGRVAILAAGAIAALIVGTHLAWRLHYYGYPLPNTFYLKSSGDPALLRARGLTYVAFAFRELGIGLVAAIALGLILPNGGGAPHPGTRVLAWIARLLIPLYVVYVVTVGGDFLDMYRFFVPLLPLGLALFACALSGQLARFAQGKVLLAAAVALLVLYGAQQQALAQRARQVSEPERSSRGIEPLGWTRLYALRWASMGRWIAAHATPTDRMAVGAAGAMPYFAGIHNLDTFGLCDAWVAHHAPIVGNRPGHQRFAPRSYILKHKPAFLLIGNDYTRDKPEALRKDFTWKRLGYVWAEAKVDAKTFGAPTTFYHYFLMRLDRAEGHAGSPWLRAGTSDAR